MSDGQFFVFCILIPETAGICAAWWAWRHIQLRRVRRAWLRQIEARRRHQQRRKAA